MASRGGVARPTGTDGNDFQFRQKIASRYELSSQNKSYVKFAIYMHFMLSVVILLQLFSSHLNILDNVFPKPQYWEYIWILSLVASIFGYSSLHANRLPMLKFYYYGHLAFGLGPILFTMLFNASDLWDYVQKKEATATTAQSSFPVIVVWYIFLCIAIQIHAFGLYFSRILIKSWSSNDSSKKKH